MPDQCSFMERGTSFLFAGAPRIMFYHPRKIHTGLSRIRVSTLLVATPYNALAGPKPAGRAKMIVRLAAGRVYQSDWQEILTNAGSVPRPYEFDVDFPAATRETWAEVAIVTQSYAYADLGRRTFSGQSHEAESYIYDSQTDPLPENAAVLPDGADSVGGAD